MVKGLKENVEYHFKVSAENQFGISRSLKSDQAIIPKTPLCEYSLSQKQTNKQAKVNTDYIDTMLVISRPTRTSKQSTRSHGCDQVHCGTVLGTTPR